MRQEETHGTTHLMHGIGIYHRELLGDVDFDRQRESFGREGRILRSVRQNATESIGQKIEKVDLLTELVIRNPLQEQRQRQPLTSLPAIEWIAIEAEQMLQGFNTVVVVDDDGCGEVAPQGWNRPR